tara:strand:+ start:4972 stop:5271 length:300 start_codon:yes stop_codon:yes gene_type:complete
MLFVPCQPPAGAKRPPGHPTTHQTKDQNSSLHYVPLATLHSQPPPRGFRSLNRNYTKYTESFRIDIEESFVGKIFKVINFFIYYGHNNRKSKKEIFSND